MITRRSLYRALAAFTAMSLAACGDVDPPTATQLRPRTLRAEQRPSFDLKTGQEVPFVMVGDTAVASFDVMPIKKTMFVFGESRNHAIWFSARSICDPTTSSYGVGTWDEPCRPVKHNVRVTSRTYYDANGHLRVDFSPAVRFNPASDGVFLFLDERASVVSGYDDISPWFKSIYYCPDVGECVDESLTDPSLATYYFEKYNVLARRIKHFSGYTISIGRSATYSTAY